MHNMRYMHALTDFKIEWQAYEELKKVEDPKPAMINDRDQDRKVIEWDPSLKTPSTGPTDLEAL